MLVDQFRMLFLAGIYILFRIRFVWSRKEFNFDPNSSLRFLMCRENIAKNLARERSRSSDHFWCTIGARFPERRYSASDIFLTMPTRSFSIVINHHVLEAWLPIYSSGQPFYGKDARRFHREWTERTTFREIFLLLTYRILFHPFSPTILWILPIRSTWNQVYHHFTLFLLFDLLRIRPTCKWCILQQRVYTLELVLPRKSIFFT